MMIKIEEMASFEEEEEEEEKEEEGDAPTLSRSAWKSLSLLTVL